MKSFFGFGKYGTTRFQKLDNFLSEDYVWENDAEAAEFAKQKTDKDRMHYCGTLLTKYGIHPVHRPEFFAYPPEFEWVQPAIDQLIPMAEREGPTNPRAAFADINKALALAKHSEAASHRIRALLVRAQIYYQCGAFDKCCENFACAQYIARLEPPTSQAAHLITSKSIALHHKCHRAMYYSPHRSNTARSLAHPAYEFPCRFDEHGSGWNVSTFDATMEPHYESNPRNAVPPFEVRSKRKLRVGEIIGIDRAHCPVLATSEDSLRCARCFAEHLFDLVPCDSGTSCVTMFCSMHCRQAAANDFHRYECPIDKLLHFQSHCRPIVRMVCGTLHTTDEQSAHELLADLLPFLEHLRTDPDGCRRAYTVFELGSNTDQLPTNFRCKQMLSMDAHDKDHTPAKRFWLYRMATFLFKTLMYRTSLLAACSEAVRRQFLGEYVLRCTKVHYGNSRQQRMVSSVRMPGAERYESRALGIGIYPLAATLSHSCRPNLALFPISPNVMALCTVRPIVATEVLSIDQTLGSIRHGHRATLEQRFHWRCNCPQPADLLTPPPDQLAEPPVREFDRVQSALFAQNNQVVRQRLALVCEYLTNNDWWYASWQLKGSRSALRSCMERLLMGPCMQYDFTGDEWHRMRTGEAAGGGGGGGGDGGDGDVEMEAGNIGEQPDVRCKHHNSVPLVFPQMVDPANGREWRHTLPMQRTVQRTPENDLERQCYQRLRSRSSITLDPLICQYYIYLLE